MTPRPAPAPPDARVVDLRVIAVELTPGDWWGMLTLAGVPIRGRSASDPVRAVQRLLWELTESSGNDNALTALRLSLNGATLDEQIRRLVAAGDLPADALGLIPDAPGTRPGHLAEQHRSHALERGQAGDRTGGSAR